MRRGSQCRAMCDVPDSRANPSLDSIVTLPHFYYPYHLVGHRIVDVPLLIAIPPERSLHCDGCCIFTVRFVTVSQPVRISRCSDRQNRVAQQACLSLFHHSDTAIGNTHVGGTTAFLFVLNDRTTYNVVFLCIGCAGLLHSGRTALSGNPS